jgi:hypothetical protein
LSRADSGSFPAKFAVLKADNANQAMIIRFIPLEAIFASGLIELIVALGLLLVGCGLWKRKSLSGRVIGYVGFIILALLLVLVVEAKLTK